MFPLGVVLVLFGYALVYWGARGITYPNSVNHFTDVLGFTASTAPAADSGQQSGGFGDSRAGGSF